MTLSKDLFRRYIGAVAVYMAMTLTVLDSTIVNVALPSLTNYFGVKPSATIWVVNAYQLAITMLLLTFAALADRLTYRKVFILGISLFTIGSLLCALSPTLPLLVAARVVQGIGAAATMSVNVALLRMIYPADKLGRGMGMNAMVVSLSTVAGPTIAGAILAVASWHMLFLINIPIGIAAFFMARRFLKPNDVTGNRDEKFDTLSAVISAAILWLIVNLLEDFTKNTDWRLIAGECVALAILTPIFIRRQYKYSHPLLPVDLLRVPLFSLSICTSIASFTAQMLAMVSLPFLLTDLGHDALDVGMLISPWPICVMLSALVAGRLVERIHGGLLGGIGMGIFALGLLLLYLLPEDASTFDIIWRMGICGLGYGTFQTPNNVTIAASSPISRSGAAGGMQGSARTLGQTIGTTLVAVVFHLSGSNISASYRCLICAMGIAIVAAIISLTRLTQHSSYQDMRSRR